MIALRCTAKLLDRLGIERRPPEPPPSTSRLGDWTATYLVARPRHLVVAMNVRTGLLLLLPGSDLHNLPPHFRDGLARLLRQAGVPEAAVRREVEESAGICYGATRDRGATAMLSQAVIDLKAHLRSGLETGPWALEDALLNRPAGRQLVIPGAEVPRVLATEPLVATEPDREARIARMRGPAKRPDRRLPAPVLPDAVQAAALIHAAPERVWSALATGEGLDQWFTAGAEVEARPGGQIRFRWEDLLAPGVVVDGGPVLEAVAPRRLVFQWRPDAAGPPTTVELTLDALAAGTRVSVRESGHGDTPSGRRAQLDCAAGWGEALALLKAWLEAGWTVRPPRGEKPGRVAP